MIKNFNEFKKECSKTGTTEESIASAEKLGFKTDLIAINPLDKNMKVPSLFCKLCIDGLRTRCCFWMSCT